MQDKTSTECFENVGELVDHLNKLGRNRALIIDDYGNTYGFPRYLIEIWNPADVESPVSLYVKDIQPIYSSTTIQVSINKFKYNICADHLNYEQRGRFVAKLARNMKIEIRKVPHIEVWTGYSKVTEKRDQSVLIKTIIKVGA